jgi:hypothetical protein
MKYILLITLSLLSFSSFGSSQAAGGQIDTKSCECETCLAKGNCVHTLADGRKVVEKIAVKRSGGKKGGPAGVKGQ